MTYMWALYAREVKRFQKLWLDTVFSPIISMILYLAVFGVVLGNRTLNGANYLAFIQAGLLAMIMVNGGFSNPGFALVIAKNLGSIVDLQVTPIAPWRIGIAYALAALTRGLVTVALAILLTVWFVPGFAIQHPFMLLVILMITGLQYGMLGVVFGMWAYGFEALTFITTFVLQPMIFLAGVFYPISTLPGPWASISAVNPIHHTINLTRHAMIGYSETPVWVSWTVVLISLGLFFEMMYYSTVKNITK